jgi:hypothetical protein
MQDTKGNQGGQGCDETTGFASSTSTSAPSGQSASTLHEPPKFTPALIAAAPSLYEALAACLAELEGLNKTVGWRDGEWHSVSVARAALELARA